MLFVKGQLVFDSGQFSRALQLFEKAIELSPKNFDAIVSMANTLREVNRLRLLVMQSN